jgi:outer membrane protein assembly factor BamB
MDGSKFQTGDKIISDIKADKYGVFAASTDGRLWVLNRASGKVKWMYFAGPALTTAPDVTDSMVYQMVPGQGLAALNKTEKMSLGVDNKMLDENPIHKPIWIAADATQFLAEDAKFSYVLTTDNHIEARDRQTGAIAFKSERSDFVTYGTNLKEDGIIYAATADGLVVAAQPVLKPGVTGQMVFNFTPVDSVASAR